MEEHFLACSLLNHPSCFIHNDTLTERKGIGQIMRDHHHRNPGTCLYLGQFFP